VVRASSPPDAATPPSSADILVGARGLGLDLSQAQAVQLERFAGLLLRWNAVHNLTAIGSTAGVLSHHLLDSLAILPPIAAICGEKRLAVLDVGAGGGLPGVPLAIARPAWSVTLVDKVEKKVAFLTQAQLELGLHNLECVHARVEELKHAPFDLIVSRAFGSLADFVRLTRALRAPGGWWAAMKGAVPGDELSALRQEFPDVRVVDIVKLDVPRLGAERHLILLQGP
jgi:16S rRNA (guanine527-N7)-methyltransferase